MTIPSRFKTVLAELYPDDDMQVVVALSLDKNLRVFPLSEYEKVVRQYEKYSDLDKNARRLKELVTGLATIEKVDAGGRIRLSADLRGIARLDREVACIGRTGYFDIWDRESWNRNQEELLGEPRKSDRAGGTEKQSPLVLTRRGDDGMNIPLRG